MRKKIFFTLTAACLALFLTYSVWPITAIALYDDSGREHYLFLPANKRFTIRFLHSWARSPVDEIFELSGDVPVLMETLYEDFGAGLPSEPEAGANPMKMEDGKIRLDGINRPVPNLQVRVGRFVANHELLYDNVRLPLSRLFRPGEAVVFKVQKVRRYTLWLKHKGAGL